MVKNVSVNDRMHVPEVGLAPSCSIILIVLVSPFFNICLIFEALEPPYALGLAPWRPSTHHEVSASSSTFK